MNEPTSHSSKMTLIERITCSPAEAAEALGISRVKLYDLIADGSLSAAKLGRRTLISVPELKQLHSILLGRAFVANSIVGASANER